MNESTTYQAILEEGRTAGQESGVRTTILRQGRKRFGAPSARVEETLQLIHDFERLEQIAERFLEVESWEELLPPNNV